MNYKTIILGEHSKIVSGSTAPKDYQFSTVGTPFIRAGHLEDLCKGYTRLESLPKVNDDNAKSLKLVKVPKDTILFAKSGMSATKNRVYQTTGEAYIVNHLAGIICDKNINPGFLRYYLKYFNPSKLILDSSYPSIRLSDVGKLRIPFPPLEIQQKIADTLDIAQSLIDKRKEQIAKLDEFLQSVFLDMFGDPVRNPKGWDKGKIRDVVLEVKYGTSKKANDLSGEYPIVILQINLAPLLQNKSAPAAA